MAVLPSKSFSQGQNFPGGSISFVSSLPATCTPGTTAPVALSVAPYAIYYCSATNTWSPTGATAGAPPSDMFYIDTACGGKANCLQWVDDDSTDNCGSATTAFMALVNGYSGKGQPQLWIQGSGSGKAYKLSTCSLVLQNAAQGNILHLWATIDCAQALQSCIQVGATNTSGMAGTLTVGPYHIDGPGGLIGGASLTGSGGNGSATAAGIYVMPLVDTFTVRGIHFGGAGSANGFGAANATLGNCTNWALYVDYPVAAGDISDVSAAAVTTSTTAGGCSMGNPNGAAGGTNTVFFSHSTAGGSGVAALGGTGCASVGIYDGGSLGAITDNNLYGIAIPILLTGTGHFVGNNQLDAAGCVDGAGSVSADIQYGASGSNTAVGPALITGNRAQVFGSHATNFLAQAGNSTGTLYLFNLIGNQDVGAQGATTAGPLIAGTTSCGIETAASGGPSLCHESANSGFANQINTGSSPAGWAIGLNQVGQNFATTQAANLGSTQIIAAPISANYLVYCKIIETQAATTSSTLPSCQITYTDQDSGGTVTQTLTPTNSANAVGTMQTASAIINIAGGNNINFQTANFASVGGTSMQYTISAQVFTWN